MTEPKPTHDTGAYHAALDCADMHLEDALRHIAAADKSIDNAVAIIQGMRESGYTTVFNPLIDQPGGEERGENDPH